MFYLNTAIKAVALLLDPDKLANLDEYQDVLEISTPNVFLVGGTQPFAITHLDYIIKGLKEKYPKIPLYLFPGSKEQISSRADGLLALSVLQSNSNQFIFNPIIEASHSLKHSKLDVVYTPYFILGGDNQTSVERTLSNSLLRINSLVEFEAYGYLLKLLNPKLIYLEAGSGAKTPIHTDYIRLLKKYVKDTYLIVGGGIRDSDTAERIWRAGADCIVLGNGVEDRKDLLTEVCNARDTINVKSL